MLTGHEKVRDNPSVFSVCPVPGRGTILSSGADDTVREWDLATGSCTRVLRSDSAAAPPLPDDFVPFGFARASKHELCVSADRRFVLCSVGGQIGVWDYATGNVLHVLTGHTNSVTSVGATADGRYALSASTDSTVRVWDLATGRPVRTLSGHGKEVSSVRAAADGAFAISHDHAARVWELTTGRCVRTIAPASSAALTADERRVLTINADKDVHSTEWRDGVPAAFQVARPRDVSDLVEADSKVTALVERALAAKADGDVRGSLSFLREARQKPGYEHATRVTDAWHRLYDNCVRVDLRTVHPAAVFTGSREAVETVAVTPEGTHVLAGTYDGKTQLWDLSAERVVRDFGDKLSSIDAVSLTPDGALLAAASRQGIQVWETHSGTLRRELEHSRGIEMLHLTPDERRLVVSDIDRNVMVWDLATGQRERTFSISTAEGDFHWTRALAVTPDGRHAVSTHFDGTLRLWELSSGWCVRILGQGPTYARCGCVTGDGRQVVTAGRDGEIQVWDLRTGECVRTLTGHTETVWSLAMTAGDRHVLSAGEDGAIRIWDLPTGRCLRTLTGHAGTVYSVSVTPDGHRAVSGGLDGTIRVWELDWELTPQDLTDCSNHSSAPFSSGAVRRGPNVTPACCGSH